MIRNLIVIAVASFVLTVICIAGVAAVGGRDLMENGWTISPVLLDDFGVNDGDDISISVAGRRDTGPRITRDLAWNVGSQLSIDVPAEVSYTQGPAAKVTITGPQRLVERIVIYNGSLRWNDDVTGEGTRLRFNRERIRIAVVAPDVKRFVLNGSQSLRIAAYDQPELAVEISGSSEVTALGKTQVLTLDMAGSGSADMGGLETQDATIGIAGSGNAEVAARGAVQVDIAGSGDVVLTEKPASLSSNIDGSGDLHLPE